MLVEECTDGWPRRIGEWVWWSLAFGSSVSRIPCVTALLALADEMVVDHGFEIVGVIVSHGLEHRWGIPASIIHYFIERCVHHGGARRPFYAPIDPARKSRRQGWERREGLGNDRFQGLAIRKHHGIDEASGLVKPFRFCFPIDDSVLFGHEGELVAIREYVVWPVPGASACHCCRGYSVCSRTQFGVSYQVADVIFHGKSFSRRIRPPFPSLRY